MRNRTTVSCAAMLAVAFLAFAMSARAHTPSCVLREDHELAKRDLNELNAKIWEFKAKHTATTGDLEDIAKAADKSKSYQGCPKCSKCPTRRRELLSQPVCLSPSEYREHLALGKEIESAKDKLKEVEHEYGDVRKDFRKAKKAYCMCDPCHAAPSPTAPSSTDAAPAVNFDAFHVIDYTGRHVQRILDVAFSPQGGSFTVCGEGVEYLDTYDAVNGDHLPPTRTSFSNKLSRVGQITNLAFNPAPPGGEDQLFVASNHVTTDGPRMQVITLGNQEAAPDAPTAAQAGLDVAWRPGDGAQLASSYFKPGAPVKLWTIDDSWVPQYLELEGPWKLAVDVISLDTVTDGEPGYAEKLAYSTDGSKLAATGKGQFYPERRRQLLGTAASWFGWVKVWDASTGDILTTLRPSETSNPTVVTFADRLIIGDDLGHVYVYNADTYELISTLKDHAEVAGKTAVEVTSLSVSNDGSLLASVDNLGQLLVWDCATWSLLRRIPISGGMLAVFSPTAPLLVVPGAQGEDGALISMFNTGGWSSYDGPVHPEPDVPDVQ